MVIKKVEIGSKNMHNDKQRHDCTPTAPGMKTFEHWLETASEEQINTAINLCGSPRACYDFLKDAFLAAGYGQ